MTLTDCEVRRTSSLLGQPVWGEDCGWLWGGRWEADSGRPLGSGRLSHEAELSHLPTNQPLVTAKCKQTTTAEALTLISHLDISHSRDCIHSWDSERRTGTKVWTSGCPPVRRSPGGGLTSVDYHNPSKILRCTRWGLTCECTQLRSDPISIINNYIWKQKWK